MDRDLLSEFSHAVAAYLNVTGALADCLEKSCPEVGGPYRQRILRLQSRVAFEASREAIRDSERTLKAELSDYALVANRVMTQKSVELESGILALRDGVETLAQRQEIFGQNLRNFAAQLENVGYPADVPGFSETMKERAVTLTAIVDAMTSEVASVVQQMRRQMEELDHRLAGAASTDPVTGLATRREMERQIDAHRLHGNTFTVVLFELHGPLSDQVLRMAANKLLAEFRHSDWVGRWHHKEIAVLFMGDQELAELRSAEALASLQGRYTLENGEKVLISAKVRLLEPAFATASV